MSEHACNRKQFVTKQGRKYCVFYGEDGTRYRSLRALRNARSGVGKRVSAPVRKLSTFKKVRQPFNDAPIPRTFLRVGTDCSGIEAPIRALRQLGIEHQHVFSSDIDDQAAAFIKMHNSPQHFYKNMLERDMPEEVDFYCAGFPCQPFSSLNAKQRPGRW